MTPATLHLRPINAQVHSVHTTSGEHVGNLKLIGGLWKFKAIGYDTSGQLVPGGGPLTDQHNTVFTTLDEFDLFPPPLGEGLGGGCSSKLNAQR